MSSFRVIPLKRDHETLFRVPPNAGLGLVWRQRTAKEQSCGSLSREQTGNLNFSAKSFKGTLAVQIQIWERNGGTSEVKVELMGHSVKPTSTRRRSRLSCQPLYSKDVEMQWL